MVELNIVEDAYGLANLVASVNRRFGGVGIGLFSSDLVEPLKRRGHVNSRTRELPLDPDLLHRSNAVLCRILQEFDDMPKIPIENVRLYTLYRRSSGKRVAQKARSLHFFMDLAAHGGDRTRYEEAAPVDAQGRDVVEDVLVDVVANFSGQLQEVRWSRHGRLLLFVGAAGRC